MSIFRSNIEKMKTSKFFVLFFGLSLFLLSLVCARENSSENTGSRSIDWETLMHDPWVDSVMNTLTPTEKLSQLFLVTTYSNRDVAYENQLVEFVEKNRVGGVIFFQGGPVRQANLTNRLQEAANVPLFVAMDAEWGLAMRLDSTVRFPYNMALGAIAEPSLIYETGAAIARHCKRSGVHIDFAPVIDVNNNPANPVINFRSFGENREEVRWRGYEFVKGMQDEGVIAVAKHFPGHGDTGTDSHLDLPIIRHDRARLDSVELYPFRFLIDQGVGGVMVAHLNVPALDTGGIATTLSEKVVTGLLKNELGYNGLVFTDALNMKGVTKYYDPGVVDMKAFIAGNDVLLFSEDVPKAIEEIRKAIRNGDITSEEIDMRCRKTLAAKLWVGLDHYKPVETRHLVEDLNTSMDSYLNMQLAEASLTMLNNKNGLLPLNELDTLKIACVSVGVSGLTKFQKVVSRYTGVDNFALPKTATADEVKNLQSKLLGYNLILTGLHGMAVYPRNNFGVSENELSFLQWVAASGKGVITVFGNPYLLAGIENVTSAEGLIVAYQETDFTQMTAAELIFGGIGAAGHLPVSIGDIYNQGEGFDSQGGLRFKYTLPEEVGIPEGALKRIDSLVYYAIDQKAIPGCQVFVAKDERVIFNKTYGYHTYDNIVKVQNDDLYDLASVTKVSGALPGLMKLYEEGKFDLEATLGTYLPYFHRGNKKQLTFREILAHQAGLKPWISYWEATIKKNGKFKRKTLSYEKDEDYPTEIVDGLYIHQAYKKKIYKAIRKSEVGEKKYLYSGLVFYLFPDIIEHITGQSFTEYIYGNFYRPLGARSLTWNPSEKFPLNKIVPTEYDSLFRKTQVQGTVHDEGAAVMGGVSSNAGLFANANDLAKLIQMYANYGEYGGRRYLKEETVREFTRIQYPENENKRGLGFDRPVSEPTGNGNTAKSVSQASFGHSGFTGTFVWADPAYRLVYVFLSNRVYPTRENRKLYQFNTRTDIHEVVYEAINSR